MKNRGMKKTIFDDPEFLSEYLKLRQNPIGHNEIIEKPAIYSLLPPISGHHVLDLGCGFGDFCRYAVSKHAHSVVGIDLSREMIARAKATSPTDSILYRVGDIEDDDFPDIPFHLVFSSLALHYVADFGKMVARVAQRLVNGGDFIFSVEHPIMTAQESGWELAEGGKKKAWLLDSYGTEGRRMVKWLQRSVPKYHRKVETYVSTLLEAGFSIKGLLEPQPTEAVLTANPSLAYELMRPPYLVLSAKLNR
jgi:SAM-dependent methyltransferase